jgi:hypothetical protein
MITVTDVLVATPGVAPDVLIDANDLHALKPRGVVDQQPLAFSQDRVVGGVPRDPESLGDTGDGEVCDHDPFQRPPQPGARELARGSAAALVSWRHTCPQSAQR